MSYFIYSLYSFKTLMKEKIKISGYIHEYLA